MLVGWLQTLSTDVHSGLS